MYLRVPNVSLVKGARGTGVEYSGKGLSYAQSHITYDARGQLNGTEKCIHVGPCAPCILFFCMVRCWTINNREMNIYATPGRTCSLHRFDVITWRELEISPRQVPPTPIPHYYLIQFGVPTRSLTIGFNIHPPATMRHGNYSAKPLPMFACVILVTTPTQKQTAYVMSMSGYHVHHPIKSPGNCCYFRRIRMCLCPLNRKRVHLLYHVCKPPANSSEDKQRWWLLWNQPPNKYSIVFRRIW